MAASDVRGHTHWPRMRGVTDPPEPEDRVIVERALRNFKAHWLNGGMEYWLRRSAAVSYPPILSRTCTLRGRPTDGPLKNAPFSRYL